ncbi:MAG: N-acetyltransferase, partial [Acidobacteriota bacterium]|nr:N-acetyltransferase [Acidobacteriota bacterium]
DAAGDLVLVHTEVPPALRGRGLADRLAAAALDYARAHHLAIVPVCPFVKKYLTRHPGDQSLVRGERPTTPS